MVLLYPDPRKDLESRSPKFGTLPTKGYFIGNPPTFGICFLDPPPKILGKGLGLRRLESAQVFSQPFMKEQTFSDVGCYYKTLNPKP